MKHIYVVGHTYSYADVVFKILQKYGLLEFRDSELQKLNFNQINCKLSNLCEKHKLKVQTPRDVLHLLTTNKLFTHIYQQLSCDLYLNNLEFTTCGSLVTTNLLMLAAWLEQDANAYAILVYEQPSTLMQFLSKDKLQEGALQQLIQDWYRAQKILLQLQQQFPQKCILVEGRQLLQLLQTPSLVTQGLEEKELLEKLSFFQHPTLQILKAAAKEQQDKYILASEENITKINQETNFDPTALKNNLYSSFALSHIAVPTTNTNKLEKTEITIPQFSSDITSQDISYSSSIGQHYLSKENSITVNKDQQNSSNSTINSTIVEQIKEHYPTNNYLESNYELDNYPIDYTELKKETTFSVPKSTIKTFSLATSSQISFLPELVADFNLDLKIDPIISSLSLPLLLNYPDIVELDQQLQNLSVFKLEKPTRNEYGQQAQQAFIALFEQLTTQNKLQEQMLEQVLTLQEKFVANHNRIQEQEQIIKQLQQKLKDQTTNTAQLTRIHGAAQKVKDSLTYRLGLVIVKNGKSWWKLPKLLRKAKKDFLKAQKDQTQQPQYPLEHYYDVAEGYRVQKHLSYRFGLVLEKTGYNPLSWVLLPFRMNKAYKQYKNDAAKK